MKKYLIFSFAILILLNFSACSKAQEEASQLIDDTKNSYEKAAKEAIKIKDKTIETVNDLQKAAKEIGEATEAIKKISD